MWWYGCSVDCSKFKVFEDVEVIGMNRVKIDVIGD